MWINRAGALLVAFVATFASTIAPLANSEAQPTGDSFTCVLTFLNEGPDRHVVSSLPTGELMTFDAYVTDSTGSPVADGVVKIAVCKLRGDSVPSDTCVGGRGHWRSLFGHGLGSGIRVIPEGPLVGHVIAVGETSDIPATRGYRCEYFQDAGGPADAVTYADFSWFTP
jgi:hypothetical protein